MCVETQESSRLKKAARVALEAREKILELIIGRGRAASSGGGSQNVSKCLNDVQLIASSSAQLPALKMKCKMLARSRDYSIANSFIKMIGPT